MQIFPRSLNKLPQIAGAASVLALPGIVFLAWYYFSPLYTDVGYEPVQPVPYSHRLHAGQMGMDCRYCHVNVERAPMAMVPPTQTCMNCHSVVRTQSAMLAPIRESCGWDGKACDWSKGKPMEWVRVHKLPEYVFFDHSVHVSAAVGCVECHGRVDQEERVRLQKPLSMGWCIECHRDVKEKQGASQFIRPVSQLTNMDWKREGEVVPPRHLNPPENCTGCHR
jgi:hypothetical protein